MTLVCRVMPATVDSPFFRIVDLSFNLSVFGMSVVGVRWVTELSATVIVSWMLMFTVLLYSNRYLLATLTALPLHCKAAKEVGWVLLDKVVEDESRL